MCSETEYTQLFIFNVILILQDLYKWKWFLYIEKTRKVSRETVFLLLQTYNPRRRTIELSTYLSLQEGETKKMMFTILWVSDVPLLKSITMPKIWSRCRTYRFLHVLCFKLMKKNSSFGVFFVTTKRQRQGEWSKQSNPFLYWLWSHTIKTYKIV